jgi:predicted RNA-binding Zn-ribbon protein involved in translation (DUF1610 family)
MSKITFRADDDLISKLEELDTSKSEVMREALRAYLDSDGGLSNTHERVALDQLVSDRIDDLIAERANSVFTRPEPQDINVNITVDGENQPSQSDEPIQSSEDRKTRSPTTDDASDAERNQRNQCTQCGEILSESHVYCPNCGEKANRRAFCECGDEIHSDWSFCPGCGRRTPAADVLDQP